LVGAMSLSFIRAFPSARARKGRRNVGWARSTREKLVARASSVRARAKTSKIAENGRGRGVWGLVGGGSVGFEAAYHHLQAVERGKGMFPRCARAQNEFPGGLRARARALGCLGPENSIKWSGRGWLGGGRWALNAPTIICK